MNAPETTYSIRDRGARLQTTDPATAERYSRQGATVTAVTTGGRLVADGSGDDVPRDEGECVRCGCSSATVPEGAPVVLGDFAKPLVAEAFPSLDLADDLVAVTLCDGCHVLMENALGPSDVARAKAAAEAFEEPRQRCERCGALSPEGEEAPTGQCAAGSRGAPRHSWTPEAAEEGEER